MSQSRRLEASRMDCGVRRGVLLIRVSKKKSHIRHRITTFLKHVFFRAFGFSWFQIVRAFLFWTCFVYLFFVCFALFSCSLFFRTLYCFPCSLLFFSRTRGLRESAVSPNNWGTSSCDEQPLCRHDVKRLRDVNMRTFKWKSTSTHQNRCPAVGGSRAHDRIDVLVSSGHMPPTSPPRATSRDGVRGRQQVRGSCTLCNATQSICAAPGRTLPSQWRLTQCCINDELKEDGLSATTSKCQLTSV